ncbi:flp pilus-assembly TadE/G-like family protein [Nocardioides panacisoli]|uniref:Rv3654c family TadE-like protein n=1 Tax=Nocardioides panacisoli TaxID=627624 RepID=UPI001C6382D5|nr:Rv3654c family TadE-like protein [Nocardioides panacisoli]QYJ03126.1 flp pilus-assembly TadE/G-like family protein [Nocardioides panacisoli]
MRTERGAATVLVAAVIGVLLLLGAALGFVVGIVVTQRHAQSAADLAALAAAEAVADGRDGCAAGATIARSNGGRLTSCEVAGTTVTVSVAVTGPRWQEWSVDLTAEARAGPAP